MGDRKTGEVVVYVTASSEEEARNIARALVEERLAACCSVLGGVRSIYRWQGRVCNDEESMLIIKTTAERFDDLSARVGELHSYEAPEIIAAPIVAGSPTYLAWLREQCAR